MDTCRLCYSYAINTSIKDRKNVKEHKDLCDVCFWKVKYQEVCKELADTHKYYRDLDNE